ncbi:Crp/Fnr family transcriptional regulator [Pseudarcicella hirudinis]|uniref:Crp/Fnr family transcriptional regulator n=1 Tax=Pseudarcicella hirudinis TaxID=1079859 RepID=UPI0035E564A4
MKYAGFLLHLKKFIELDEEEENILIAAFHYQEIRKKEHVLQEGQVCTSYYFILKGCFRSYFINENANEQVVQFGIENWWITDYDSLLSQRPSFFPFRRLKLRK